MVLGDRWGSVLESHRGDVHGLVVLVWVRKASLGDVNSLPRSPSGEEVGQNLPRGPARPALPLSREGAAVREAGSRIAMTDE